MSVAWRLMYAEQSHFEGNKMSGECSERKPGHAFHLFLYCHRQRYISSSIQLVLSHFMPKAWYVLFKVHVQCRLSTWSHIHKARFCLLTFFGNHDTAYFNSSIHAHKLRGIRPLWSRMLRCNVFCSASVSAFLEEEYPKTVAGRRLCRYCMNKHTW